LVGEFSAFAKLPQASLEPADLGEWLREASRSLETIPDELATAEQTQIECVNTVTPLPVRIDAMMLKRAVDNLVRNAVQALTSDDVDAVGHVRLRAGRDGEAAQLEVADDGPGISIENRARVFDPYYTTKAEGTGLGLAIVKKVVLEHGGEIDCTASDLGGAAFVIRLPLRRD
jgi:signal transduction histidine kinase